ncbi:hypothetical protein Dimus_014823 [Dionaea muscipula]
MQFLSSARKCDSLASKTLGFLLLLHICLLSFPPSSFSGEAFSDEKSALLEFKASVSDPSGLLSNWVISNSTLDFEHCSWYGVVCDSAHRISSLRIIGGGGGRGRGRGGNLEKETSTPCFDVSKFPFYGFGIRRNCSALTGKLIAKLSPAIGKLSTIRVLSLPFNEFSGEIPRGVWELKSLEVLDLEGNSISGNLPAVFRGLRRLRVLNLGFNRITGEIPYSVSKLVDLEVLNLAGNGRVHGSIPSFLGGSSKKLWGLYLSMNQLTGEIPHELGSTHCGSLKYLDLSGNLLNGSIPTSLGDCGNLRVILLFSNRLRGSIPSTFGQLKKLQVLDVSRNNLSGPVPTELGYCVEMSVLVLSNLYDPFLADRGPPRGGAGAGAGAGAGDDGEGNSFTGSFPMDNITALPKLRLLWAPKVSLRGKIPTTWGAGDDSLEMINLSMNYYFTGGIKGAFRGCRNLIYIDLSSNKLKLDGNSIMIPPPCMIVLNINGNSIIMSGATMPSSRSRNSQCCRPRPMPSSGIAVQHGPASTYLFFFASKAARFVNSKFEFFPPRTRSLQQKSSSEEDVNYYDATATTPSSSSPGGSSSSSDNKFNSVEVASIVCAAVIILVFFSLVILLICTRKCCLREDSSRVVEVLERREITTFTDIGVPLTFEKIVESTENFSASNCIGSGGFGATYKAEISPGIIVAVKRLAVGRFHCVQQFHAEIQTLGQIRHSNLVTLVGYHASEAEMFLIYNYLPGGNLEGFIQERGRSGNVNWKTLHKIALDIATALTYLHDDCGDHPRVIHRDVKPSNILLDDDLNAYLSDFGLSRLLGPSETHATTGVAGTFGYLAPEYALTCRVSDKCDVYSYGVVLLELISNKKALDPSFSSHGNGFNIVPWACMLLRQGRPNEVFNAGLWDGGPRDDLVQVLYLAVKCTVDTLSIRPTMKQVVQRLRQLRPRS